jgi:cytochrome c'
MKLRTVWFPYVFILGATMSLSALAPNAPPAGGSPPGGPGGGPMEAKPSPAEQAIEYRQALYTLFGGNFEPIGGIMQGHAEYNAADGAKRAERVAFLATMVSDAFPELSKEGKTKAVQNLEDSTAAPKSSTVIRWKPSLMRVSPGGTGEIRARSHAAAVETQIFGGSRLHNG